MPIMTGYGVYIHHYQKAKKADADIILINWRLKIISAPLYSNSLSVKLLFEQLKKSLCHINLLMVKRFLVFK